MNDERSSHAVVVVEGGDTHDTSHQFRDTDEDREAALLRFAALTGVRPIVDWEIGATHSLLSEGKTKKGHSVILARVKVHS